MRKVYGFTGIRGSGKDTAASVLIKAGWAKLAFGDGVYEESSAAFGSTVAHFRIRATKETRQAQLSLSNCSDPEFVKLMLARNCCKAVRKAYEKPQLLARPGIKRRLKKALKKPLSPRVIMQYWGTDYRRKYINDDYWIQQVQQKLDDLPPDQNTVITDVRFKNEADKMKAYCDMQVVRITRPSQTVDTDANLKHSSEQDMLDYPAVHEFINQDGTAGLDNFLKEVTTTLL